MKLKGSLSYVLVLVLALLIYFAGASNSQKQVDWDLTLGVKDRIPFGAYIFRQELAGLFPGTELSNTKTPVYNTVSQDSSTGNLYFYAGPAFQITSTDRDALFRFAERGNQVFVSSTLIDDSLVKRFHLDVSFELLDTVSKSRASVNSAGSGKIFSSDRQIFSPVFKRYDSSKAEVLGRNNANGKANFLRFKYGKGSFYFLSCPKVFSNYFILQGNNSEYVSEAMSQLSPLPARLFYDTYYQTDAHQKSFLVFVLSDPSLRMAYYGGLVLLLLYVMFEAKRRQRAIPVLDSVKNQTLAFVQSIALLYLGQKNNQDIAQKMAQQLLEYIQLTYYMDTAERGEEFITLLSAKSGQSKDFLYALFSQVNAVQNPYQFLSDESLSSFNNMLETFYSQTKNHKDPTHG